MPTIHFQQLYPRASPLAIDLLEKLLNFDPAARITVEQALAHPYLAAYHEEDDEPSHETVFDFSFEVTDRIDEMKRKYLVFCSMFRDIWTRFSSTIFPQKCYNNEWSLFLL